MKKLFGCVMMALSFIIVFGGSFAYADCKDKTLHCIKDRGTKSSAGTVNMGQCFYLPFGCDDCKHTNYAKYANECNEQYASECKGKCWACYPADGSSFDGELTCYDTNGKGHNVP